MTEIILLDLKGDKGGGGETNLRKGKQKQKNRAKRESKEKYL